MSDDNEICNFVLKHSDINTDMTLLTATSSNGWWVNGKQKSAWTIDLQTILGDTYNKYDEFILEVNQFATDYSTYAASNYDFQWNVVISGLSFINSTYNQATGNNTNKWQAFSARVQNATPGVVTFNSSIYSRFKKDRPITEIMIEFMRMTDGTPIQSGTTQRCPHSYFNFSIRPVKE